MKGMIFMIAVHGVYDNGTIRLETLVPATKTNVIVIFSDEIENSSREQFHAALKNDMLVIPTCLNADEYIKEMRDDERV